MPRYNKHTRKKITVTIVAIIIAAIFLFPIYWTFLTAFRSETDILKWPPSFLPMNLTTENFEKLLAREDTPVFLWFFNSLIAATAYATLSVLGAIMAAYALARLKFKFRDTYFKILIASMTIPPMILFLPNYTTVDSFGWTDNLIAIIIPGIGATFGVFLLRQFFVGIPKELEEAAVIDGANVWQRMFRIIVPLSREAIITLWVINFMTNWNDYLWPLVVLYSPDKRTLPVGMSTLQGTYIHYYGIIMAGAIFIAAPSIAIFLLVQRYYMSGISISGAVKE
ncbi:MAG: carbohydrate ABC transporter permease [Kosmotogaceae bacterium]